jgi:hypothetical protein
MNFADCHSTECLFADCHSAECFFADCHSAECFLLTVILQNVILKSLILHNTIWLCHVTKSNFTKCQFPKCHSAECQGAMQTATEARKIRVKSKEVEKQNFVLLKKSRFFFRNCKKTNLINNFYRDNRRESAVNRVLDGSTYPG